MEVLELAGTRASSRCCHVGVERGERVLPAPDEQRPGREHAGDDQHVPSTASERPHGRRTLIVRQARRRVEAGVRATSGRSDAPRARSRVRVRRVAADGERGELARGGEPGHGDEHGTERDVADGGELGEVPRRVQPRPKRIANEPSSTSGPDEARRERQRPEPGPRRAPAAATARRAARAAGRAARTGSSTTTSASAREHEQRDGVPGDLLRRRSTARREAAGARDEPAERRRGRGARRLRAPASRPPRRSGEQGRAAPSAQAPATAKSPNESADEEPEREPAAASARAAPESGMRRRRQRANRSTCATRNGTRARDQHELDRPAAMMREPE